MSPSPSSTLEPPVKQARPAEPVCRSPAPRRRPDVPSETARRPTRSVLGQRRRFLVDWKAQLRAASLSAGVALVLVLLLNLSLHVGRSRSADDLMRVAPELAELARSQDRVELSLVLLASVVFVAGVFVVTVLETHRTSGAAYSVARRLRDVRDGRHAALRLRKGDNLVEVERAFNEMTAALLERAAQEIEALDEIAASMAHVSSPPEAEALAARIRGLADRKRSYVEAG